MSEELKLLPCPACIGVAKFEYYKKDAEDCYVVCPLCEMRGPWKITKHEAITAWNALPRALTWTTEPPKVDGNYWWKCEDESMNEPFVVHVTMYPDGKYSHHFHYGDGPCFHECDKCRWAGPIPCPK